MNSKRITAILMSQWIGSRAALPNYMGRGSNGESDIFLVTPSAYCEEVEIKVSLADFRREFKTKQFKHGCLTNAPGMGFTRTNSAYLFPRRFWFAAPFGLAERLQEELAGTCYGLLEVTEARVIERLKPKVISGARKLTQEELVAFAKCMTFRIARHLNQEVSP